MRLRQMDSHQNFGQNLMKALTVNERMNEEANEWMVSDE